MNELLAPKTNRRCRVRDTFLPFALPDIDETEHRLVQEVLDSGWLTTGPKTRQLEKEFANYVGASHAVAVNSCTAAMHLALEGVGLQPGDLVITTPYTFAATAEVIRYFDAIPVFVDVDPVTLNIDVNRLEETVAALVRRRTDVKSVLPHETVAALATERTGNVRVRAIIPVHLAGYPCDLEAIYDIAGRFDLAVIEDAAHAFPAKRNGKFVGGSQWGSCQRAVCYSFYATKTMTTGEGGMICTPDAELADRYRLMALHGISKDAWKRYTAEGAWRYDIIAPGYKYNMPDLAAALGLAQLKKAERMRRRRRDIAKTYSAAFESLPELTVPHDSDDVQHSWHLYMLRLNLEGLAIDRARFVEELKLRNIGASVHFIPLHLHPYYREKYGYRPASFPVADREYRREISLPIYSKMSDDDVDSVVEAVTAIVGKYACRTDLKSVFR